MLFILCGYRTINYFYLSTYFNSNVKRMKFGQSIREEGPQSHMKTGTPTMGGLTFSN